MVHLDNLIPLRPHHELIALLPNGLNLQAGMNFDAFLLIILSDKLSQVRGIDARANTRFREDHRYLLPIRDQGGCNFRTDEPAADDTNASSPTRPATDCVIILQRAKVHRVRGCKGQTARTDAGSQQ